MTMFVLR